MHLKDNFRNIFEDYYVKSMGAIPETNSYLLISSKAAFLFLFFLSG